MIRWFEFPLKIWSVSFGFAKRISGENVGTKLKLHPQQEDQQESSKSELQTGTNLLKAYSINHNHERRYDSFPRLLSVSSISFHCSPVSNRAAQSTELPLRSESFDVVCMVLSVPGMEKNSAKEGWHRRWKGDRITGGMSENYILSAGSLEGLKPPIN